MKKTLESRIAWEGVSFYVFEVRHGCYEVRKNGVTHAVVYGRGANKEQVIRTAKRLDGCCPH